MSTYVTVLYLIATLLIGIVVGAWAVSDSYQYAHNLYLQCKEEKHVQDLEYLHNILDQWAASSNRNSVE